MDASPPGCWRSDRRKCWGAKQRDLPEDGCGGLGFLGATPVSPFLGRWSRSARLCESPLEAGGDCGCYWSSEIADAEIKDTRYWTFYFWVRYSFLSPDMLRGWDANAKSSCLPLGVALVWYLNAFLLWEVGDFGLKNVKSTNFFWLWLREVGGERDDIKNR